MFWVPAMVGGVFGLVGGYLTDRLGRRRVLTWSILLYAVATFASGLLTSILALLVLRCLTFIGVCVEFVAAVAWLAELFPNHQRRERALGYTQAFSSLGGLLVGSVFLLANKWADALPALMMPDFLAGVLGAVGTPHATWRYTLISGVVPAIPLIVIRPFLPESPVWEQKKAAGTLKRPSFARAVLPRPARTTIVTTIMFACSYGAAFGAIQQMPQIVPGLPGVRAEIAAKKQEAAAAGKTLDAAGQKRMARGCQPHRRPAVADSGNGRPDRALPARLPGRAHRQPAIAAAPLSDARPDRLPPGVRLRGECATRSCSAVGNLRR